MCEGKSVQQIKVPQYKRSHKGIKEIKDINIKEVHKDQRRKDTE